jgi:hypothetical protein
MKRLVKEGHAEPQGGRKYIVLAPKKALKRARKR